MHAPEARVHTDAVCPARAGRTLLSSVSAAVCLGAIVALGAGPAWAQAIRLEAVSSLSSTTPTMSRMWAHTVPTPAPNGYLVVGATVWQLPPASPRVSTVTYGGRPLALLGATTSTAAVRVELWGLVDPQVGMHVVEVRLTEQGAMIAGAASYTGVHQTVSTGSFASQNGTGVAAMLQMTSAVGEMVIDIYGSKDKTPVVGPGQMELWNLGGPVTGASSTTLGAPVLTLSWSHATETRPWVLGAIAFRPAASSGDGGAPGGSDAAPPDGGGPAADAAPLDSVVADVGTAVDRAQDGSSETGSTMAAGPESGNVFPDATSFLSDVADAEPGLAQDGQGIGPSPSDGSAAESMPTDPEDRTVSLRVGCACQLDRSDESAGALAIALFALFVAAWFRPRRRENI